jgi:hypothetical protein
MLVYSFTHSLLSVWGYGSRFQFFRAIFERLQFGVELPLAAAVPVTAWWEPPLTMNKSSGGKGHKG